MPRPSRRSRKPHPLADPALQRQVERLIGESRSSLPDAADLDAAAQVEPADVDRAGRLWNEAQRRAGTGLEGLLDAKVERE
jgi:hypothetical protein